MSVFASPCFVVAQCVWQWLPGEKVKHVVIRVKINIRGYCFIVWRKVMLVSGIDVPFKIMLLF